MLKTDEATGKPIYSYTTNDNALEVIRGSNHMELLRFIKDTLSNTCTGNMTISDVYAAQTFEGMKFVILTRTDDTTKAVHVTKQFSELKIRTFSWLLRELKDACNPGERGKNYFEHYMNPPETPVEVNEANMTYNIQKEACKHIAGLLQAVSMVPEEIDSKHALYINDMIAGIDEATDAVNKLYKELEEND